MDPRFNFLSRIMVGFAGSKVPGYLPGLASRGLRSVALYGENIVNEKQLVTLISGLKEVLGPDGIIALDEEGGDVTRVEYLSGSRFAGNGYLGVLDDKNITRRDGQLIAQLLDFYGINLNLAPVADVNSEPKNPVIGNRSFGSLQENVAEHVQAMVLGHEQAGVGTTLKHFPGHGNVLLDSHSDLPEVPGGIDELREHHWLPFKAGIAAGASAVMVAHLDLGDGLPTSLSPDVIKILRSELAFTGLIVTDAMDMGALGPRSNMPNNSVQAALAGNDIICMGPATRQDEIDQMLKIWDSLDPLITSASMESTSKKMASFLDRRLPAASKASVTPEYPDVISGEVFPDSVVLRLLSRANPAVGEVPWYPGVKARDVSIGDLQNLDLGDQQGVLMVRSPEQLGEVGRIFAGGKLGNLRVISSNPLGEDFAPPALVTFGAAKPQAQFLNQYLARKE